MMSQFCDEGYSTPMCNCLSCSLPVEGPATSSQQCLDVGSDVCAFCNAAVQHFQGFWHLLGLVKSYLVVLNTNSDKTAGCGCKHL